MQNPSEQNKITQEIVDDHSMHLQIDVNGKIKVTITDFQDLARSGTNMVAYWTDLEGKEHLINEHLYEAGKKDGIEECADFVPKTPKHWDKWSIERQLGYNRSWMDIRQSLRDKFK